MNPANIELGFYKIFSKMIRSGVPKYIEPVYVYYEVLVLPTSISSFYLPRVA
jgi:hypothetical protein